TIKLLIINELAKGKANYFGSFYPNFLRNPYPELALVGFILFGRKFFVVEWKEKGMTVNEMLDLENLFHITQTETALFELLKMISKIQP
ncbi:hypothetical protein, partial [Prevotellamassilia timonensis]|uniref:hypothetical protein n=1 Tax=Prevotellamassilia timonensis TaxID=1852370 RepID=UPI00402A03F7